MKHGSEVVDAKVRRVGAPARADDTMHSWSMLTLDIHGECAYAVARADELAA